MRDNELRFEAAEHATPTEDAYLRLQDDHMHLKKKCNEQEGTIKRMFTKLKMIDQNWRRRQAGRASKAWAPCGAGDRSAHGEGRTRSCDCAPRTTTGASAHAEGATLQKPRRSAARNSVRAQRRGRAASPRAFASGVSHVHGGRLEDEEHRAAQLRCSRQPPGCSRERRWLRCATG